MRLQWTPWVSMELPWNSKKVLVVSMEPHGTPWSFHGTPWNSMELPCSSMEFHGASMELHGASIEFHGVILHGQCAVIVSCYTVGGDKIEI